MARSAPHRVLVADDSALCRAALRHALESDPEVSVVGEAEDGEEAVRKVQSLAPTLVTIDLQMPRMGGLAAIEQIMRVRPTPILVVTEQPRADGVDATFAALSRGALDLLPKSQSWFPGTPEARELVARVKQLSRVGPPAQEQGAPVASQRPSVGRRLEVIGIGASTGGPSALAKVLSQLPKTLSSAVVVVQHMDPLFVAGFVDWLDRQSALPVRLAQHGALLKAGEVLVGPSGIDFLVDLTGRVQLFPGQPRAPFVPSVDQLFFSLARAYRDRAAGVLLTGMGSDGAKGLLAMRELGALTLAQDRESSAIYGMPGSAVAMGAVNFSLPLSEISDFLAYTDSLYQTQSVSGRNSMTQSLQNSAGPMARGKILLVDDSSVMLEAGRIALEDAGYEVLTLDNPLSLASVLRKDRPDLVLCDVNMPAINGDAAAQIVAKAGFSRSPIVLYSDISVQELDARARQCGARGFIQKTGDDDALVKAVEQFLAMR
jgi:two-component system chemotaxis response regulator CheB